MRNRFAARVGWTLIGVVCLAALFADVIAPGDPFNTSSDVLLPPSWSHPLGSDDFGRDLLGAIVHGARVSITVGITATVVTVFLGLLIGAIAGYRGGVVDNVLMRITEVFQIIPRMILVVVTVALFGSGLGLLTLIIALTSWPDTARLVRSEVLRRAASEHVMAARAIGAGPVRILLRHIVLQSRPVLLAQASFQAGGAILAEAGVSFIGLGDPSVMTWGLLLHEAHHFLRVAWWLAVFPGIALTMTILGLQLIADGQTTADSPGS